MAEVTYAMKALRGWMRMQLSYGGDVGAVMFEAAKRASEDGIRDEQFYKIVSDFRLEGVLPG